MESEHPRAGDMGESYSEDKLEKMFNLVVGLDEKMSDIEKRIAKLEEDDVSTVAFRSISETIVSEDNSKEEKLSLLAEGFVLPDRTNKYKCDKGVEKLVDQIVANMNKLWPSINKSYYKIRKYTLELFSLCGCEHFGNDEPCPTSIDVIVKKRYDAMDEDEKDEIVNNLSKDIFGVVRSGKQTVLCREDYLEYTQKVKN